MELIMVCRSAKEPLQPGYMRGRRCKVCGEEVQISPTGQDRLQDFPEIAIYCNPCGLRHADALKLSGELGGVLMHPEAQKQLERLHKKEGK